MSSRAVKLVAWLTVVMSIPLLLSYNIKYQRFPEGLAYGLLFYWGLLSVFVVPVLLILGLVTSTRVFLSSDASSKSSLLAWSLSGVLVGATAEVVFIAARNSAP